jgi:hypothetical protein
MYTASLNNVHWITMYAPQPLQYHEFQTLFLCNNINMAVEDSEYVRSVIMGWTFMTSYEAWFRSTRSRRCNRPLQLIIMSIGDVTKADFICSQPEAHFVVDRKISFPFRIRSLFPFTSWSAFGALWTAVTSGPCWQKRGIYNRLQIRSWTVTM